MEIEIMGVNLRYKENTVDSVNVRFEGQEEGIFINGNFSLTETVYNENKTTEQLIELTKSRLGVA